MGISSLCYLQLYKYSPPAGKSKVGEEQWEVQNVFGQGKFIVRLYIALRVGLIARLNLKAPLDNFFLDIALHWL